MSSRKNMRTVHQIAIVFGAIHYLLTLGLAFIMVDAAASGLSDVDHGDSGEAQLGFLAFLLQAPVVIVQWVVVRFSHDGHTGLSVQALLLIAMPSSLAYGYVFSYLLSRLK